MPGRPKYKDWDWKDLPEEARKAASVLGWDTQHKWDESVDVPYRAKKFDQLTMAEKRAAIFLQINLIGEKYDIYWSETDDATKKAALALDWTEHKWDDDWELWDLEVDHKYWKEMTEEEKAGAMHFGYTQHTWDEDMVEVFEGGDGATPTTTAAAAAAAAPVAAKPAQDAKKKFQATRMFGGKGGTAFDHGTNRGRIKKITVYSNRKSVEGVGIIYEATGNMAVRNGGGSDGDSLELDDDEYINKFTIRADDEVQCLTFFTNKGKQLGPCGGKGGFLSKGGEEFTIAAPKDMMLSAIKGQAGSRLDAIAFYWGPC